MQASRQHHHLLTALSARPNPAVQPGRSLRLVLRLRHLLLPAPLPDQGSRSLSLASSHVAGRKRKVQNGSEKTPFCAIFPDHFSYGYVRGLGLPLKCHSQ